MKNKIFLNDKLYASEEAKISVLDRGFLFSDGIYELIPYFNSKPFLFNEHYSRLKNSLKMIRLDNPYSDNEWSEKINSFINGCDYLNFSLYIQITRGVPEIINDGVLREHAATKKYNVSVCMFCSQIDNLSEFMIKEKTAITMDDMRWLQCDIKSISLLYNSLAKTEAHRQGSYEAILIRDNSVTEGCASNVFIVKNDVIKTAPQSNLILPGVTRSFFINEIIKKNKFQFIEKNMTKEELVSADEVFITNSTQGILPITYIDKIKVNNGKCGVITKKLHQYFLKSIN